jgi:hypothetical protein
MELGLQEPARMEFLAEETYLVELEGDENTRHALGALADGSCAKGIIFTGMHACSAAYAYAYAYAVSVVTAAMDVIKALEARSLSPRYLRMPLRRLE